MFGVCVCFVVGLGFFCFAFCCVFGGLFCFVVVVFFLHRGECVNELRGQVCYAGYRCALVQGTASEPEPSHTLPCESTAI